MKARARYQELDLKSKNDNLSKSKSVERMIHRSRSPKSPDHLPKGKLSRVISDKSVSLSPERTKVFNVSIVKLQESAKRLKDKENETNIKETKEIGTSTLSKVVSKPPIKKRVVRKRQLSVYDILRTHQRKSRDLEQVLQQLDLRADFNIINTMQLFDSTSGTIGLEEF